MEDRKIVATEDARVLMDGIAAGLMAIDARVRDAHRTGGPGTGIFFLLDNLAVAAHATPRTTFPAAVETTDDPAYDPRKPLELRDDA